MEKLKFEKSCILGQATGRPVSDDHAMLLEQLFEWLDANLESNVFEVSYLVEKMIELDSSPDKSLSYSHRHLKRKLTEHYGNILFFTNQARRKDLICLRDNTANILRDHQKNTMTTDAGGTKSLTDQKMGIIRSAVQLIPSNDQCFFTVTADTR